jgi:hypothetical protein
MKISELDIFLYAVLIVVTVYFSFLLIKQYKSMNLHSKIAEMIASKH